MSKNKSAIRGRRVVRGTMSAAVVLPICLCGITTSTLTAWAATPLTLAVNGRPNSVIVLPAKSSAAARQGAEILADHLSEMCGGRFVTLYENDLGDVAVKSQRLVPTAEKVDVENFILVGESGLTRKLGATAKGLGPGGTLIRTYPNTLVLLGPDDSTPSDRFGTRHAVTSFLERALGCRYLWPGEDGKVVPKRKRIEIAPLDLRFTPGCGSAEFGRSATTTACAHNWATQGLNYYILAQLHWNPDLDVDALIDDYCRAGFGNGAEHVKRYLLRLEGLTDKIAAEELFITAPYTPKVIDELRAHVARDEPPSGRLSACHCTHR